MDDKDKPTLKTSAVPARRGYTISRIEAPPIAANNPPRNFAASDNGGGKGRGRGRKRGGGKGGNPAGSLCPIAHEHTANPLHSSKHTEANDNSGGLDRGRPHHHDRYHNEHDDRAAPPPTRIPPTAPAGTRYASFHSRQHQHDGPQSEDAALNASSSKPGTTANAKVNVKGRGRHNSSRGGGGGGVNIFDRLGSPPTSPSPRVVKTIPTITTTTTNNNDDNRIDSPPPSPYNITPTLSRADANSSKGKRHDRAEGHRPKVATLARSSDGARGAATGSLISGAGREPLPHPRQPSAANTTNTKQGQRHHHQGEHKAQRESSLKAFGTPTKDAKGGSGRGGSAHLHFSTSSPRGAVVNHAAQAKRAIDERSDGARNDSNRRGPGRGGGPDAAAAVATSVPGARSQYRTREASGNLGRARSADSSDNAQHRRQQQQQQERERHKQQPQRQNPPQHQQTQTQYARGTCMSMCPDSERREREAEGGLSSFEATETTSLASVPFRNRVADPNKTVKKYRRSAAGRDMHSPEQLRPLAVLQTTTQYLVQEVFAVACSTSRGGSSSGRQQQQPSLIARAYVFVEDRLRAVRQDLTIQGLLNLLEAAAGAAEVLKTTANFYIVAGYLLCEEATDVIDRHLHTRELQGVFSSLAELFFLTQAKRAEPPPPLAPEDHNQCLGTDEYLCLQAVHALATAFSNYNSNSNGSQGGDTQLEEAAGEQGIGRVFNTTISRLCGGSSSPLPPKTNPNKQADGDIGDCHVFVASAAGIAGTEAVEQGGVVAPLSSFRRAFPKMAMAVRLLGVVCDGNWSDFFRMLGKDSCDSSGTPSPGRGRGGMVLVGDVGDGYMYEGGGGSSSFAIRLRCLCHGMLGPVRAHALRAMNKAYGKGEKVPLRDVARMLRARDVDHAEDLCRALSLPIEGVDPIIIDEEGGVANEGNTNGSSSNSNSNGGHQTGWSNKTLAVVFKRVPAVWTSEGVKKIGCYGTSTGGGNGNGLVLERGSRWLREDDWVGLTRALAAAVPNKRDSDIDGREKPTTPTTATTATATATCIACAGFGCGWCENGVVPALEQVATLGGEEDEEEEVERGLWLAALCPT